MHAEEIPDKGLRQKKLKNLIGTRTMQHAILPVLKNHARRSLSTQAVHQAVEGIVKPLTDDA